MKLDILLEMAADAVGDRILVGSAHDGLSGRDLAAAARCIAPTLEGHAVLVSTNGPQVPVLLFAAACAGVPFAPLNYRLDDNRLRAVAARVTPGVAVVAPGVADRLGTVPGLSLVPSEAFLQRALAGRGATRPAGPDGEARDAPAVLLFTSGTTGEPKAAVLRAEHLAAYVLSSVELGAADPVEATLVSVPPYHIAGIATVLTSVYAGRRIVYLESFDPERWVEVAAAEGITHAMVVPTMLRRIMPVLERSPGALPSLRHLAYGGGVMPQPVIARALELLPDVDFANAYGLTETSSTIAVLGPDDHRAAASGDPQALARLGSVGRPLPEVEIEIRNDRGRPLPAGDRGEIWVRGPQVAGEYRETGSTLDAEGWFRTRDGGWVDADGYLHLSGRLDDVIVRGGENISPGEVEAVLLAHPAVSDAAVVGVPDEEWGQSVCAVVVLAPDDGVADDDLRAWVRERLRSTKTPDRIVRLPHLPYNDMGKLVRRELQALLAPA